MRTLLLGGGGFIGRHILVELLANGHDVTAVVRRMHGLQTAFPMARFAEMDLAEATDKAVWQPLLVGVDLVVNAAGLLRGKSMHTVHVATPRALYAAAKEAAVRRIILISAISARSDVYTDYARTKLEGEDALRASGLEWTIFRPSLVYAEGSYGGTSLIRGLAGLPFVLPLPGRGDFPFTPIYARDLARAVRIVCEEDRFSNRQLEPVGPETLDLGALLQRYRNWLGFRRGWRLSIPMPIMRLLAAMGDLFGSGPISTNSLSQMIAGNSGDSEAFANAIGFRPRSLDEALLASPVQVQDRWHARLFFLAPAIRLVLVLMWIASGVLGLMRGAPQSEAFVAAVNLGVSWAGPLRIGTSLVDFAIAGLLLVDLRSGWSTAAQVIVVSAYTLVLGLVLPSLWLDPLGPLMKNVPIMLLILVYGAIGDRR